MGELVLEKEIKDEDCMFKLLTFATSALGQTLGECFWAIPIYPPKTVRSKRMPVDLPFIDVNGRHDL